MTKFCMSVDIYDIITCATFCDDRLRGLGVAMGRISSFPTDLRRRPYNTPYSCNIPATLIVCSLRINSCIYLLLFTKKAVGKSWLQLFHLHNWYF